MSPALSRSTRITARLLLGAAGLTAAFSHLPSAVADDTAAVPATSSALGLQPALGLRGPATAIVILGYGLLPDGTMRPELVARLHAGFAQAVLAPASPVIVTGGNAQNGITEARAMADYLIQHGIPAFRVIVESHAASTVQNAAESARIIHDLGVRDAVVVTSADHLERAVSDFRHAGVAVTGTVTPDQLPTRTIPFGPAY